MKRILVYSFLSIAVSGQAQTSSDSTRLELFKEIVFALADDSMMGRAAGSLEESKSLAFISKMVRNETRKNIKIQHFEFPLNDSTRLHSKNGYVFFNNHAKKTILIGAHYDHIGLGGELSLSTKDNEIHNGADDNASGVALLLSLLNDIGSTKADKNFLIVFYSAHELGLYGSEAFAAFCQTNRRFKNISTVINFDMVGRLDPSTKRLKCMSSFPDDLILTTLNPSECGINLLVAENEKLTQLDTKFFLKQGIPCLNFTTGLHDDYHSTTDDSKYISFEGMLNISKYLKLLLAQL